MLQDPLARKESPLRLSTTGWLTLLKAVFFLSGFTGLVFEVLWTRQLATVVGATSVAMTCVFSVFIVWLVKAVLMRYGGPRVLRAARPFFLGLILGQFAAVAFWLLIDWLAGEHGHSLYWV